MRTGSIPSGPGKGKFPITDQHSVDSATRLIGHAKNVSRRRVARHIVAQAKAKGLVVAAKIKADAKLAEVPNTAIIDLAGPQRYRHGWIPIGPGVTEADNHRRIIQHAAIVHATRQKPRSVKSTGRSYSISGTTVPEVEVNPSERDRAIGTPYRDRTPTQHAIMRENAVRMHGTEGGRRYDKLRSKRKSPARA